MRNIIAFFIIILMGTTLLSCEDFIDISPQDQISVNDYFKTSNDIENYVKKYYGYFPTHGTGNIPASEDESDNLILSVPNNTINGSRNVRTGQWTNEWDNIRSINILFDNIDRVKDDISSYQQYLGEAHFFRAWFYFNMLVDYGDLPIYTTPLYPDEEALFSARNPRTEVADFIIKDIDLAIKYLGLRSSVGNSRLNKEAALAFKTRVALFEGSWQKYHKDDVFGTKGAEPNKYFQAAIDAAEELINGNYTKGIYSTGEKDLDYFNLFGMDNMSSIDEVLFYRIADTEKKLGHDLQLYITKLTGSKSLTWSLITSYLDKNGEPYDYSALSTSLKGNDFLIKIANDCDPRLKSTVWIPGDLRDANNNLMFDKPFLDGGGSELAATGFQVKKFGAPYSAAAGKDFGGSSQTGLILFRYAEVLLNYAEAKYELSGTVAYSELNLLRERIGMPAFSVIPKASYNILTTYGYNVSDALYAIRNERRVELALEGFRINDYRRWAAGTEFFKGKRPLGYPFKESEFPKYSPLLNSEGLIDFFQKIIPNGYGFNDKRDYLKSIPQDELTLNTNLVQNPGW